MIGRNATPDEVARRIVRLQGLVNNALVDEQRGTAVVYRWHKLFVQLCPDRDKRTEWLATHREIAHRALRRTLYA